MPVTAALRNSDRLGRNVATVGVRGRVFVGEFMLMRAPNAISRREPGVMASRAPTSDVPDARAVTGGTPEPEAPPNIVVVGKIGPFGFAIDHMNTKF